ncbi:MAG: hypothetical protein JWL63_1576 [Rhodocyclales bacterium]|nr:hypothetical protein [Rhodocyclales bacterium]
MKDIYVKFGKGGSFDIKGESRDDGHKDCLEVNSWHHQIIQPKSATASTAGGHTAERCEHGAMIFTKDLDMTSPSIWAACSAGQTFDEVVIDFMRADGAKRIKYLEVKLKNVLISSVSPSVAGEGIPVETMSLTYAAVQWTYTQQDITGAAKGNKVTAWSLAKNTSNYAV